MSSVWPVSGSGHAVQGVIEVVFRPDNSDRRGPFQERDNYHCFFREIRVHNEIVAVTEKLAGPGERTASACRDEGGRRETAAALEGRFVDRQRAEWNAPHRQRAQDLRDDRDRIGALLEALPADDTTAVTPSR